MSDKPISKSSRSDIDAFIEKVSNTPVVKTTKRKGRLIFAMDATASREASWDHACHLQAEMFEETTKLGGLEIQLCYYRGLAEFDAGPWVQDSRQLHTYMRKVFCLGGHTQIGKVLGHALNETKKQKINALVFVGDCMEENIDELCQQAGQLAMHGVPVFLFQEGYDPLAASAFKQIAKLTDGAYCAFDQGSAQQLKQLLSAVAVYAAGGLKALEDFNRKQAKPLLKLTRQSS